MLKTDVIDFTLCPGIYLENNEIANFTSNVKFLQIHQNTGASFKQKLSK